MLTTRAELATATADHETAARLHELARNSLDGHPPSPERDTTLLGVLVGLGHCLRRLGRYTDAAACLAETDRLAVTDPGLNAAVRNAQGVLCKDTGRFEEAADHYARADRALSPDDPAHLPLRASLQHNIAGLAHVEQRFDEGEEPARRAVELRRRVPGARDTDVALDEVVLAAILAGRGRLDEAEVLLNTAVAAWTTAYGPDHYEVAVCLHNIADIERSRGQLDAAMRSFRRALEIKTATLGSSHAEIAALCNNIAALHRERGETDLAARRYVEAATIFTATLGADHPHTAICIANAKAVTVPDQWSVGSS